MNFVSVSFWLNLCLIALFVCLVKLIERISGKHLKLDRFVLLAASLILFATEDLKSFLIFVWISLFVRFCTLCKRFILSSKWVSIIGMSLVTVAPLLYYKYGIFFSSKTEVSLFKDLAIPIGLSFYTFQLLSFYYDEWKSVRNSNETPDSPEKFVDYLNFASFFPQIVAGPIERRHDLLPQLRNFNFTWSLSRFEAGAKLIILGLFYKLVMADNLAASGSWITLPIVSPLLIHLGNLVFALRIYADFCGYSMIAIGLGKIVGIELTHNFSSPYTRANIRDFWRSWHITLTNWLRDYVYIPLGGNKVPLSILAVFVISGIWHGAGLNFIIWGGLHGLLVMGVMKFGKIIKLPRFCAWALTMFIVSLTWLPFYQWDEGLLLGKFSIMFNASAYFVSPFQELQDLCKGQAYTLHLLFSLVLGCFLILIEFLCRLKTGSPYGWGDRLSAQVMMVIALVTLSPTENNAFVYFNF